MRKEVVNDNAEPPKDPQIDQLKQENSELKNKLQSLIEREQTLRLQNKEIEQKMVTIDSKMATLQDRESAIAELEKTCIDNQNVLKKKVEKQAVADIRSSVPCILYKKLIFKDKSLGHGSFGDVQIATWRSLDVAVKRMFGSEKREGVSDTDLMDLFYREVKIMARLRHPNIVLLMAACLDPKNKAIILELCQSDLYDFLHKSNSPLSYKALLGIAIDICSGLAYLHACVPPVYHRDVKSANVLLDAHGVAKITDFGYASYKDETSLVYTKHGLLDKANRGTPAYMAPESFLDVAANDKSDVYSFGVILWEMMERAVPWQGLAPENVYAEVTTGHHLQFSAETEKNMGGLMQIAKSCLLESPEDRPTSKLVLKQLRALK